MKSRYFYNQGDKENTLGQVADFSAIALHIQCETLLQYVYLASADRDFCREFGKVLIAVFEGQSQEF